MTPRKVSCRWLICPGCGHERRLARDGRVMCRHNRWEPAARAMVPCEGSGRQPIPDDPDSGPATGFALPSGAPVGGSAEQARPARRGAA